MGNDYSGFPDHPLHGVNPKALEVAREAIGKCAEYNDVSPSMVDPVADFVVMRLREEGFID